MLSPLGDDEMPIIKPYRKVQNKTLKLSCPSDLLEEVQRYCAAFHIEKLEEFFMQAAQYVLANDKDWTRSKKSSLNDSSASI